MTPDTLTIIGTGIALAILNVGLITSLRADMKTDRAEAAADRRAFQQSMDQFRTIIGSSVGSILVVGVALAALIIRAAARFDADRCAFQAGMDTFRTEMQRLAERQSNLEGRLEAGN